MLRVLLAESSYLALAAASVNERTTQHSARANPAHVAMLTAWTAGVESFIGVAIGFPYRWTCCWVVLVTLVGYYVRALRVLWHDRNEERMKS